MVKKVKKKIKNDIEKGVEIGIQKGIDRTINKYTRKFKKEKCDDSKCNCSSSNCGGFSYFLGFLGAAIYYISNATGFWHGVLGFLKAIIWPLFLVLELFKYIGA